MTCIVLAAGYATRLYPLTENFPKPLLDVGGKPILDWLLGDVAATGLVDEYYIISNHKYAHHFTQWAQAVPYPITVLDNGTISNETRLGAVKDLQFTWERLEVKDDLLVLAGDNLLDFSLEAFIRYAREKKTSCVMRYYEHDIERCKKSGVLTIDDSERILDMQEKPQAPASHWLAPPFYFLTQADARRIGQAIADGCATDAPGSFIAWLCKNAPLHAMQMPGRRYDIGDLKSYEEVKRKWCI
ncbi:MAG: sugar phosphate nucleotidyltransferase [Defluviitaleaceae bacterium]|nr:sugar phosphate nucleotidyltransferase [Defluviitaleaceae bacterium]MCL2274427.1 sugar phosphate nucleotidyltransferase [Defluviitaleaceae bacterium]